MKKVFCLIIVGFLVLSGLGAVALDSVKDTYKISETMHFSKPVIKQDSQYITVDFKESTSSSMAVGKPILPKYSMVYTLPFGTRVENVEVLFSETIEQRITKPILPAPEPQIVSAMHKSNPVEITEMVETYSDIDMYPDSRYSIKTGAGLKDCEHVYIMRVNQNFQCILKL